jgi:hypothetical protein
MDAVEKHENNLPVNNQSILVEAKAPQPFLTFGIIKDLINKFLIKTGKVFDAIANKIKNNADSFNSYSRNKVKKLRELEAMAITL